MVHYLVMWQGQSEFEASWEDAAIMEKRFLQLFLHFQIWGQVYGWKAGYVTAKEVRGVHLRLLEGSNELQVVITVILQAVYKNSLCN